MAKRKKKETSSAAADGAASTAEVKPEDAKFAEGLSSLRKLTVLRERLKRRLTTFKRVGRVTPESIKRLIEDLFDALD